MGRYSTSVLQTFMQHDHNLEAPKRRRGAGIVRRRERKYPPGRVSEEARRRSDECKSRLMN